MGKQGSESEERNAARKGTPLGKGPRRDFDSSLYTTRGQMTNSPPSNVNSEESLSENGRILSSGFDSLVLGLSIEWKDESFLNSLEDLKSAAAAEKSGMPGSIKTETDEWIFNVQPQGASGYRWLLNSHEYDVRILRGTGGMRPSAMIEIRSATLWARGAIEAVNRIVTLLTSAGAKVGKVKASRADGNSVIRGTPYSIIRALCTLALTFHLRYKYPLQREMLWPPRDSKPLCGLVPVWL